ncbi:MAG: type II toxin-antitoxin system HicA family toxin [Candidatus Liptonbacteria bacterium]|nr:type II toxin-antitoxin system HicA family toxin [Candidatus Liptonbacteria bacterium]
MKRRDFLRHLGKHGCRLIREGGRHSVYSNPITDKVSSVPRHSEINRFLAEKICKDLGIPVMKRLK